MITADQCLAHLETLVVSRDPNALVLAEASIEELLQSSPDDRSAAALHLGEIQARLLSRTASSPLRADISDLLGTKIVRLLESAHAFEAEPDASTTSE